MKLNPGCLVFAFRFFEVEGVDLPASVAED
jgi:hypothetical protein